MKRVVQGDTGEDSIYVMAVAFRSRLLLLLSRLVILLLCNNYGNKKKKEKHCFMSRVKRYDRNQEVPTSTNGESGSGNKAQSNTQSRRHAKIIGCSTCTPMACAIAPTANGTEDAPDAPIAEQIPTAGTCNDFGRTVVRLTIIAGNKGPRKKPAG